MSLINRSYINNIPRTAVPNVSEPQITPQYTFATPPFTLENPPVSVFSQLFFGSGVLFCVTLH
jgi:hypothetical protein